MTLLKILLQILLHEHMLFNIQHSTFQNTHLAPQVYVLVDAHTFTYLISPLIKYQNSSFDLKSALGQQNL